MGSGGPEGRPHREIRERVRRVPHLAELQRHPRVPRHRRVRRIRRAILAVEQFTVRLVQRPAARAAEGPVPLHVQPDETIVTAVFDVGPGDLGR